MYGCTTVSIFVVSVYILSTGFTVAYPKAPPLPYRKSPDCTGKDLSVSVMCPSDRRREISPRQNRSTCCFFSVFNSSHPSEACASTQQSNMSTNDRFTESRIPPPDCLIRITAVRSDSNFFTLRTCEGSNVRLLCEVNVSCSDVVRWRSTDGAAYVRRVLPLSNVQKEDSGIYICEATDSRGKIKQAKIIRVEVQFAPVIIVPNSSISVWIESEDVLECQSEANPKPTITWYRDGILLDPAPSLYTISSENKNCKTTSYISFKVKNISHHSSEDMVLQNYTCVAENELGKTSAAFLIASFTEESSETSKTGGKRPFNVTGFIVGMLPPLLISFYIILKLGYRSRYAEERGEDDGFREEPFFISY